MNRIIIAEDHQPTRECIVSELKTALKSEGIHVNFDQVDNGEDLVEMVLKEDFAVALIDNHMGSGDDGLKAIKNIKELRKSTALVMISSPEYEKQALGYGANGYVIKPDVNLIPNIVRVIRPYLLV